MHSLRKTNNAGITKKDHTMKNYLYILLAVSMVWVLNSCYYDNPAPTADLNSPPLDVSFSGDVIPILNTNCNYSGCHATGGVAPDLTAEVAYYSLVNGYVNTSIPEESILFKAIQGSGAPLMPPGGQMVLDNRKIIYDWIRTGAKNN